MIYLVALALIEQEGRRFLPIGGKSVKDSNMDQEIPGINSYTICLELLTRVMNKSAEAPICLKNGQKSLLVLKVSMESMQEYLPKIKSKWVETGDTTLFFSELEECCISIWSLNFKRYEGLKFNILFSKSK